MSSHSPSPITTVEQALDAGRAHAALTASGVQGCEWFDLTGHMHRLGIPSRLRSAWLLGYEEGLDAARIVQNTDQLPQRIAA